MVQISTDDAGHCRLADTAPLDHSAMTRRLRGAEFLGAQTVSEAGRAESHRSDRRA